MAKPSAFVRQHPILIFVGLAYLISWLPWMHSAVTHGARVGLFPFGPLIAAFIVRAVTRGRTGLKEFGLQMIRWRCGWNVYAWTLGLAFGPLALVVMLNWLLPGGALPDRESMSKFLSVGWTFPAVLILGGPLGEEPGWRGFLLPAYVQEKYAPLISSIFVGVIWALWHLPLFFQHLMPPPAALAMLFGSVTFAWLYFRSGGSVLVTMLFHTLGNTFGGSAFFHLFPQGEIGRVIALRVAIEVLVAIALGAALWSKERSRSDEGDRKQEAREKGAEASPPERESYPSRPEAPISRPLGLGDAAAEAKEDIIP